MKSAIRCCAFLYPILACLCIGTTALFAAEEKPTLDENIDNVLTELALFNADAMERAIEDLAGKYPEKFKQAQLLADNARLLEETRRHCNSRSAGDLRFQATCAARESYPRF